MFSIYLFFFIVKSFHSSVSLIQTCSPVINFNSCVLDKFVIYDVDWAMTSLFSRLMKHYSHIVKKSVSFFDALVICYCNKYIKCMFKRVLFTFTWISIQSWFYLRLERFVASFLAPVSTAAPSQSSCTQLIHLHPVRTEHPLSSDASFRIAPQMHLLSTVALKARKYSRTQNTQLVLSYSKFALLVLQYSIRFVIIFRGFFNKNISGLVIQ